MTIYRCFDLCHIAARDGERLVAVLDEQLGGAGMGDNLLNLGKVYQESPVATHNNGVGPKRLFHLFHCGAEHVGMCLFFAKIAYLDVIAYSLDI